jgi:hypothetical protein
MINVELGREDHDSATTNRRRLKLFDVRTDPQTKLNIIEGFFFLET